MDKPLTVKHALMLLVAAFIVAALPVGWMFSMVDADVQAVDYRLDSTNTSLDAMNLCRVTKTEAEANKERIAELEATITAWEGIASACENAIRSTQVEGPVMPE